MSSIGRTLQLISAGRQDRLIAAEQEIRSPLPVIRRVAFAALAGGTGCSTVTRRVAATLASRRSGGVLLALATDEERRVEQSGGFDARHQVPRGIETVDLPAPVWPDGIANWRIHTEEQHRAHELTLTDWGKLSAPQLFAVAAHSHLVCLTTTAERRAVQQALDVAAAINGTGTRTLIIASAVRGRARLGARRMVAALPCPALLMPFDSYARLAGSAAAGSMVVNSLSQVALVELGGAIVTACGQASFSALGQQAEVTR